MKVGWTRVCSTVASNTSSSSLPQPQDGLNLICRRSQCRASASRSVQSAAEISGLWWRTASSIRQRRNAGPRSMACPSHSTAVVPSTEAAVSRTRFSVRSMTSWKVA